jgi:hypothetical protein
MSRDSTQNSNHSDTSSQEASEIDTETPDYYREYLRRLIAVISNNEGNEGGAVDWLITFIRSGASDRDIFKALLELTADYSSSEPTNRAP